MSLGNIITERINIAIAQTEWKEEERQRDTEKYMGGEKGVYRKMGERDNNKCEAGGGREGGRAGARKREGKEKPKSE